MSSSSDESDDTVNAHNSTVKSSPFPSQLKREVRSSSQSSSSEDDTNPTNRGLAVKQPPDSSSESESNSDDDHHSATKPDNNQEGLTNRLSHQKSSSESSSSSEDEDRQPKQQLSKENTSTDDGSSDHEDKYRARQTVPNPQQTIQNSSEDSEDDSSDSEEKPAHAVRAAHTMSSSDSEYEEVRAAPESRLESGNKNQIPTEENSSESESDDPDHEQIQSTAQSNALVGIISRKPNDDQVQIKHEDSDESSSDESTGHVSNVAQVARVKKEHDARSLPVASGNDSLTNEALHYFGFSTELGERLLNSAFKDYDSEDPSGCLLSLEEVSNNQEIWLIQCPKSMNLTSLKKQHLLLGGNSDFQIEDGPTFKRFSISSEPSHTNVNCVLPSTNSGKFHVASLPIVGKMVIQEHVHVPKLRRLEASESGPVPFPSGLRVRHPLLGVGFQEHITNVQSALKESQLASKQKKIRTKDADSDESQWPRKKSKKRKRESFETTDVDDVDGSLASFVQPLSKKQKMNYLIDQPVAANDDLVLNSVEKKKKKRDKYASDILSSVSDSGSCNEGNAINSSKKRRRASSTHDASDSPTSSSFTNMNSDASSKKHKKHKKSKSNSSICSDRQTLDSSSIYESVSDSDRKMKKKLKKAEKGMSISHSNYSSETDLLVESLSEEQRKRNKSHSGTTSDSPTVEAKESSFLDEHSVKKHKKQKKSKSKLEFDDAENEKSKLSELNEPTGKKKIKLKLINDITSENVMSKSSMPMWHIPQTDDLPSSVQNREMSVDKKHKKKKDRDNDSLMLSPSQIKKEYSGLNGYNNESESDVSLKKKKSKKKHKKEID